MKYVKAQNVLPVEVIRIIQQYVDGEFIYVPRKEGGQKAWGEKSGARDSLKERNYNIYEEYKGGIKVSELSRIYYLSEQSIRRILSQEKLQRSNSLHNGL
ncbi:MAG TPA: CD3324 family protein [Clostridia bacterium]|nr:CD3324 family protein [Clostridia bacterium]